MTMMTILQGKSTSMSIILWTCLAYLCASIQAQGNTINISINPSGETMTVRVGQNITILCNAGVPVRTCSVEVPGEGRLNLRPTDKSVDGVGWYGQSTDAGQCGVRIPHVKEKHGGVFRCSLTPMDSVWESSKTLRIVVAKAPVYPELTVSPGRNGRQNVYEKGETLMVSCRVKGGRPAANVTIFLGDEQIGLLDGLKIQNYDNESTVTLNATRTLTSADNGKALRCNATHLALDQPISTMKQISVLFAPQPQATIEKFGLVIGQPGAVEIKVQANPRPRFTWSVDKNNFTEEQSDESGRIKSSTATLLGEGNWLITLNIDSVQKSDTEKKYALVATNEMGTQTYDIVLSTSTEPAGDLDAGSIIGIVVGVLILLLIAFLIIFARATGRWCFAGGSSTRTIGESDLADPAASVSLLRFRKPKADDPNAGRRSDTESAGRYSRSEVDSSASAARRARAKMTFSQLFKRNKDKVSGTDTDTVRTVVTIDDEKIQPSDAPQAVALSSTNPAVGEGGLVYAELDLTQQKNVAPRRIDDDATEYAEIIYTKPEAEEAANAANK